MLFMNVTWMEEYDGLGGIDKKVYYGGTWVQEHGYGEEIYNFRHIKGKVYGYAQPAGYGINIDRLGAKQDDDCIKNQLVVFTATPPKGRTCIVGWYKNATIYRSMQSSNMPERKYGNGYLGYYVVANSNDVFLLPKDSRKPFMGKLRIPRGKGGMGRSNIWYADSAKGKAFQRTVLNKIKKYEQGIKPMKHIKASPVLDEKHKKKVEKVAIRNVKAYYKSIGYKVISVENDNIGWDLEAMFEGEKLRIEVKGLSGKEISVRLTPNEYSKMNDSQIRNSYRLAVVTNTLSKEPNLFIFHYNEEKKKWRCEDNYTLTIDEKIAALCYVKN